VREVLSKSERMTGKLLCVCVNVPFSSERRIGSFHVVSFSRPLWPYEMS